MSRDTEIRKSVLLMLDAAFPYAQPEDQLLVRLNLVVRPPADGAELVRNIAWMEEARLIASLPGDLGDEKKRWLITEAGQAQNRR